ncbi:MAG TPA: sigma-70 family RNA polymerase sigma factor [Thermoanaerobaculia bacterium]|nr:sigma-70 family RNA polymerase sigma factor [Thermoanaerobaculia bacterium]
MTVVNDAETVQRVLAGDADAFRLLVDRHGRTLHRLAFRLTGSADDAEDVVQEAFIRAFRQLASYDGRAAVGTWLHRITVNCAVDLLRARRRRPEDSGHEETLMSHHEPTSMQEQHAHASDIREAVARGMASLSANERTAFVLRHFEGMSIDEIGRTLGTKVNATKHTVFRAVQKLRQELEPLVR